MAGCDTDHRGASPCPSAQIWPSRGIATGDLRECRRDMIRQRFHA
jgi:hypothetical protein